MTDVGGFDVDVEHHASEDVADVSVTIYHHGSEVTLHLDEEELDELAAELLDANTDRRLQVPPTSQ